VVVSELYQFSPASRSDQNRFRHTSKVQAEVEAHLDPASGIDKSWKRNASLAGVKLLFESSTAFSNSQAPSAANGQASSKVAAVVRYLQEYGKASTAYNDLRPFVEHLSSDEHTQLLAALKSNSIFSEAQNPEAGPYPTKEDVSTHFLFDFLW
jgi:N-terminal acetyltransferase B complex non-catalytic subunit